MKNLWTTTGDDNYAAVESAGEQLEAVETELETRPAGDKKRQFVALGMAGLGIGMMLFGIAPYFSSDSDTQIAANSLKGDAFSAQDVDLETEFADLFSADGNGTTTAADTASAPVADDGFADITAAEVVNAPAIAADTTPSNYTDDGSDLLSQLLADTDTTAKPATTTNIDNFDFSELDSLYDNNAATAGGLATTTGYEADLSGGTLHAAAGNTINTVNTTANTDTVADPVSLALTAADTAPEIIVGSHRPNYNTGRFSEAYDFTLGQQAGAAVAAGQTVTIGGRTYPATQQPVVYLHNSAPRTAQSGAPVLPLLLGAFSLAASLQAWRRRRTAA